MKNSICMHSTIPSSRICLECGFCPTGSLNHCLLQSGSRQEIYGCGFGALCIFGEQVKGMYGGGSDSKVIIVGERMFCCGSGTLLITRQLRCGSGYGHQIHCGGVNKTIVRS